MDSTDWQTNAHTRIQALIEREGLVTADIELLMAFARRLAIDPFDVVADRDRLGEFYSRIGPSATVTGRDLAASYRIDGAYRTVDVISFSLVPTRR